MTTDNLWYWITERHRIWERRQAGALPPWTMDPVLARGHFTNVYRELDPGTKYIVAQLRDGRDRGYPLAEAVMTAVTYRMGLWEDSMDALGGWIPIGEEFARDSTLMTATLSAMARPFTNAYMVSNLFRKGPKVGVVIDVLGKAARHLATEGFAPGSREDAVACLRTLQGVGPFIAFQAVVALSYAEAGGWLPWSNDGFALAGPGCKRGLKLLFPAEKHWNERVADERLAELCAMEADRLPRTMQYVDRANMQNCCCEYGKWAKATDGRGGLRRLFDAVAARERDRGLGVLI